MIDHTGSERGDTPTTPALTIRRGTPADAAPLAELAARTFAETFAAHNTPEDMAAYLKTEYGVRQQGAELLDPDVITLLADGEGSLAGYAQLRRHKPPLCVVGEKPIELWRFYVDRPWHGRGLARRLLAAAHDAAHELGGRTLWLGVWEHNPRAIAFYRKCGFEAVGEHSFWVGGDEQRDLVMVTAVRGMTSGASAAVISSSQ